MGFGFWVLDFGFWILDFGFWTLDFGFWVLDFGFWILDFGFWVLDFGFWVLGFGFWIFAKYISPCMVRVAQTHKHGFVRFTQASPEKLDSATDRGRLTTRESSHGSGALPIPFLVSGDESASVTGDRNLIPGLG